MMAPRKDLKIVPVSDIPEEVVCVPLYDLSQVYNVCKSMEKVCLDRQGIGLSAVQVGIPWKLFIIKKGDQFEHYLNCVYEPVGNEMITSIEGCLSLLNEEGDFRRFELTRHLIVKVDGSRLNKDLTIENFSAFIHAEEDGVVFQHEIDHFLGAKGLISNKGKEILFW